MRARSLPLLVSTRRATLGGRAASRSFRGATLLSLGRAMLSLGCAASLSLGCAALLSLGCASTAPLTGTAAAVHTGLAAGLAAADRSSGGCWAVCTHGTVCNPHTGFCEQASALPDPALAACLPGEPCSRAASEPAVAKTRALGTRQPNEIIPGAGLSPVSGTAPPFPPAKTLTPTP